MRAAIMQSRPIPGSLPGEEAGDAIRLRYAGDQPLSILRNWLLPHAVRFDEAQLVERGLYALLREVGRARRPVLLKRGANSIQLCHEHGRWWVFCTVWDNEREGLAFDLF